MGFATNQGNMRTCTIVVGIGVAVFCFGLCLLIFGRAYQFDSTHHDLFLAFGCVFMIPGGLVVVIGLIQLFRIYLGFLKDQNRSAPPPADNRAMEDVFVESGGPGYTVKGDFPDTGHHLRSTNPYEPPKSAI